MRRRLVLAITGVAAAAVALFALPLAVVVHSSYQDQELLRLQRDTVAAARSIDLSRSASDPVEIPGGPDRITVYDGARRRVAGQGSAGPSLADAVVAEAIRTRRPAQRTPPGQLVVAVPLLTGEQVSGAIRAERSDAAVARRTHRAWRLLAAAGAVVIMLAAGAALLLGRRLARPLERVAAAAQRLGDGDFSVRAPRGGIAEVDEVAAALDATAGRLDELIARERAFSADASHQLRTPLAALRLELETLELETGPGANRLEPALAQVERLQQTIDTLLAVARDAPRRAVVTDLASLLRDLEARWRGPLAQDGRPLHVVHSTDAQAAADAGIVSEILDVLVDNARRHGAGPVTITVRDVDSWVAIAVEDQGDGFADGMLQHAFARRAGDDHGIGLALAQSLAHAEGGRLTVTRSGPQPVLTLLVASATQQPESS